MKVFFVSTTSWNIYNSRMSLAKQFSQKGIEIVFVSPKDEFTQFLLDDGYRWINFPMQPRGKNIFRELFAILFLIYIYKKEKPDIVNHFTPKGVIYGSLAAKLFKNIKKYNTITGLGTIFANETSHHFLRRLVIFLYWIALKQTIVIFQNNDNLDFFISKRITGPKNSFFIPGSGIDTNRFVSSPEPEGVHCIVLLSSRFIEEKGLHYFVDASRILLSQEKRIRFVLVGKPEDDQPTRIRHSEISQWVNEGVVEWWGWHNQMEKIYPLANIVCLPTYYMEGIPKSLIEAAACGRALISTDVPGCREIVHHGENGILIPIKDAAALANAISTLCDNRQLRAEMGRKSREIAVSGYSIEKVASMYYRLYNLEDNSTSTSSLPLK